MSRRWLLSLFCLAAPLLLFVQLTRAGGALVVNEAATRFLLREPEPQISLVVENAAGKPIDVTAQVELLDPENRTKTAATVAFKIKAGRQNLAINLPLNIAKLSADERDELLWYRLRYRLTPAAGQDVAAVAGVISLSEMTPDLFQIRVASSSYVREGMRYRANVRAQHPITGRPARGVRLEGKIEFDDDDTDKKSTLHALATTDHDGFAVLDFDLPRQIKTDSLDLKIAARRGSLLVEESLGIDFDEQPFIFVTTDKPMYQPGQVLHARVLLFGPAKRAIGNAAVTLRISDPEDDELFEKELTTSRFGVASADWPIPESSRLGNYKIEFETEDDKSSSLSVKVSRYDLPNFTVNVKPDRSYYLPQQNAEVEVAADYLFGQPVNRGHVRVVRETERVWNYREQKYDVEEGEKYEGETDAKGVFKAKIDLRDEQKELEEADYQRFRDLSYAAYFTDPTTNRTEQRRFDLRITRDAIHLYIIKPGAEYYQSAKLPLGFYVSTFYADGTPAPCKVAISASADSGDEAGRYLRVLRTNRLGLAKVERLELPEEMRSDGDLTLNFLATDSEGRTGKHGEGFYLRERPALRVETDKILYRDGEPISVMLSATERELTTLLEVVRDQVVVHSEIVRLHGGRAALTLPWIKEYTDELTIAAFSDLGEEDHVAANRTVLYPHDRELKLGVSANQPSYRPGADAQVSFRVRDPRGRSLESALGVVIFDKAVEERARNDEDFGSGYNGSYSEMLRWLGNGDSIAGIGRKDLDKLDLAKPVAPDLALAAEIILNQNRSYYPRVFGGEGNETDPIKLFLSPIKNELKPVRAALQARYERTREYPTTETALRSILNEARIDFAALRDPWGTPYKTAFSLDRQQDSLVITAAGADKEFNTSDDFEVERFSWYYFRTTGEAIDRAVEQYHTRTRAFIRNPQTLKEELQPLGIKLEGLVDRWSHPYRLDFRVAETRFLVAVTSAGPNGKFESTFPSDDFTIWTSAIDYFAESRAQVDAALAAWVRSSNIFPQSEAELRAALRAGGVPLEELRDPWGRGYYSFLSAESFYGDRAKIETRANFGEPPKQRIEIKPVTQKLITVKMRSAGEDGKEGTPDDFTVASFSGTVSEQAASELVPQKVSAVTTFAGSTGAIRGVVLDPNGAVMPGVKVTATRANTSETFNAETDDNGKYLLRNLPVGLYTVRLESMGFQAYVIDNVLVHSSNVVEVNATLTVAAVAETVSITAESSSVVNTTSATLGKTVRGVNAPQSKAQLATPRLREYFPETLLWQPALETDRQGRAQINFKLADNITTWKIAVIGSTEDGQLGTVEKEIKSFQPFFVEHDPPRVLTEGDEISLPVVVRNYLARAQAVDLDIKPENWFTMLGPAHKRAQVAAGDARRETFDLRATGSVKDGKQRITARAAEDNDAIEKPVTVHPDGQELTATAGDVLTEKAALDLNMPESVIPGSMQAELKIYPNLMGHVAESIEAIMKRPYGCGEQTISSTYPSLLLLKHDQATKSDAHDATATGGASVALRAKAQRYLNEGYQRLLNYRDSSGGFTYWGRGEPDVALTAYALRFLNDAGEVIEIDNDVLAKAEAWLLRRQAADGRWFATLYGSEVENKNRTVLLTAYVARVLAALQAKGKRVATVSLKAAPQKDAGQSLALRRALDYLSQPVAEIDEPYLLAAYALASADAGDAARATPALVKLRALAHTEGNKTYWSLETNTPFNGWGLAGRVETTALVVQALARSYAPAASNISSKQILTPQAKANETSDSGGPSKTSPASQTNDHLIRSGLLFLLKAKDRYGVWHSTQATINVLDAMLLLLQSDSPDRSLSSPASAQDVAEIIVNGQPVQAVPLPGAIQFGNPITINLSRFLRAAGNRIELRRPPNSSPASVQAVVTYYVPWSAAEVGRNSAARAGASSGLRLLAKFGRTEGKVGDEITCHVEAERVGFRGYGMMLAEIGLPPGADVDRASLETAMKSSGWAMSQYDILPDRVVVYLWPPAGGVKFDFSFRPRFGMTAWTAPSQIYDYYNPDARAVVAPSKFIVK